jgi:hypothetical protein
MVVMRESWTDERLDEFGKRIDERFDRVDERFDEVNERLGRIETRLDRMAHAMLVGSIALSSTMIAGFASLTALALAT